MKKWVILLIVLIIVPSYAVCVNYAHPSEEIIKREFVLRNSDAEIIVIKLVSDEVAIATYQIEYRKIESSEIHTKNFTLQQCMNWDWKSNYIDCEKK